MSLTYADFHYYQVGREQDSQENVSSNIPLQLDSFFPNSILDFPSEFDVIEECHVPLVQNTNISNEFFIIAEFSELEGPIPLCTIPYSAPEKTDINLGALAVHLMSTDYQVNSVGKFKVCQDTQVLRTNVFKDVHAIMQYLTLYDIKARGFVRPFCFGFVSKDHVKIDRLLNVFLKKLNKISKILKESNRHWFSQELSNYLCQLSRAKDDFLLQCANEREGMECDTDENEKKREDDSISLNQIALQYTEIEAILQCIHEEENNEEHPPEYEIISNFILNCQNPALSNIIDNLGILTPQKSRCSIPKIDFDWIPLVHPLKRKGETLRPLTTLGQFGTIYLVLSLLLLEKETRTDFIFLEMGKLTEEFKNCALNFNDKLEKAQDAAQIEENDGKEEKSPDSLIIKKLLDSGAEPVLIIEKLSSSLPLVSPLDNKSESFHSITSEEDSDPNLVKCNNGNESSNYVSAIGSVESLSDREDHMGGGEKIPIPVKGSNNSKLEIKTPEQRNTSISSDEDLKFLEPLSEDLIGEVVEKIPWWDLSSATMKRGTPGSGLLSFFRKFPRVAHHVVYSILIGRPLVICGKEEARGKVNCIINAIIPFVPTGSERKFKILRWHRGILISAHLNEINDTSTGYKIIGLCIPERLEFQNLLSPKDLNKVTVLDMEKKKISGPAYSGSYLHTFELNAQKNFIDNLSLFVRMGSILNEITDQVFMLKSILPSSQKACEQDIMNKACKKLGLLNSDIDIVKYLSGLITLPEEAVQLF